ncbi:MAG: catalytic domain of component of various dehydrogenase complexe [Anaerocolumna sp.]|nr:catalytic domain of component of various dehydrogenase complexe [Anaerocolumna sp.]
MENIRVTRINANDDTYILKQYFYSEKEKVEKGATIASLSSSKSVVDITSNEAGVLHIVKQEQEEVAVGAIVAIVFETLEELERYLEHEKGTDNSQSEVNKYSFTKLAREFAEENHFTEAELEGLNKKLIKKTDLEELLKRRQNSNVKYVQLSRNQRSVARTVMESHNNIPKAFHLMKVDCTVASTKMGRLTQEFGMIIGYGEVLTVILKEIFPEFPLFYSRLIDDEKVIIPEKPNIGVTIDIGNGLFIPVVKSDQAASIEEAAEVLTEHKLNVFRGELREEQLSGGTISISLNTENNIVTVIPVILPGQAIMLTVGAEIKELAFDKNNMDKIVERKYINIGIAYDHRIINGFEAMEFLKRIREKLETFDVTIYKK